MVSGIFVAALEPSPWVGKAVSRDGVLDSRDHELADISGDGMSDESVATSIIRVAEAVSWPPYNVVATTM